jgi:hypothetical protein
MTKSLDWLAYKGRHRCKLVKRGSYSMIEGVIQEANNIVKFFFLHLFRITVFLICLNVFKWSHKDPWTGCCCHILIWSALPIMSSLTLWYMVGFLYRPPWNKLILKVGLTIPASAKLFVMYLYINLYMFWCTYALFPSSKLKRNKLASSCCK